MTPLQTLWAILCVAAISAGQLLFKRAGMELEAAGSWRAGRALFVVAIAMAIYGAATLLWIHLLRHVPLHKAYIFMSLSFVLVPLASYAVFREHISGAFLAGTVLIVCGVAVATLAG